jgi:repressor LexA
MTKHYRIPFRLKPRQRHILAFIRDYIARYGYAPLYREIGAAVGISESAVSSQVMLLESHGYIVRSSRFVRSIVSVNLPGVAAVQS